MTFFSSPVIGRTAQSVLGGAVAVAMKRILQLPPARVAGLLNGASARAPVHSIPPGEPARFGRRLFALTGCECILPGHRITEAFYAVDCARRRNSPYG